MQYAVWVNYGGRILSDIQGLLELFAAEALPQAP